MADEVLFVRLESVSRMVARPLICLAWLRPEAYLHRHSLRTRIHGKPWELWYDDGTPLHCAASASADIRVAFAPYLLLHRLV